MKFSQIYLLSILLLSVSCSVAPVENSQLKVIPETATLFQQMPQPLDFNNRGIASDEDDYSKKSFQTFFSNENYYNRLVKIRKLAAQLSFLMSEKGHPRQHILEKFKNDLDNELTYLSILESKNKEILLDWVPDRNGSEYQEKIQSLIKIDKSFQVMKSLEKYLSETKVMDEDTYEQNFYYLLMNKAMKQLHQQLVKSNEYVTSGLPVIEYVQFLNSVLRQNLPFYFLKEHKQIRQFVDRLSIKIQNSKSMNEVKSIIRSKESKQVRYYLGSNDIGLSSDIEGFNFEMNRKIATYFSFEMIRYLAK